MPGPLRRRLEASRVVLQRARRAQVGLGFSGLRLTVLAFASVVGAISEAGALALVVFVAASMSGGGTGTLELGPVDLSHRSIGTLLLAALVAALVRMLTQAVGVWLPARITTQAQSRLRTRLYRAFLATSWAVKADDREGQLQELMSSQVSNAGRAALNLATGVGAVCSFASLVAAAIVINPLAAGLVVIVAVVLAVVLRPLGRAVRRVSAGLAASNLALAEAVSESVRTAEDVHAHGVTEAEAARMARVAGAIDRPFFRAQLLSRGTGSIYQGVVLLLVIGALAVLRSASASAIPMLGAVVLILVRSLSYGQMVQTTYQSVNEQLPSLQLVQSTTRRYEAARPDRGLRALDAIGSVELRAVGFGYRADRPVLHDITLSTVRGEVLGIVGPSGGGKSSLVQLLLQLRDPTTGAVLVDGAPAEELDPVSWFRRVAYVPQEARVVAGTVTENIRFQRPWVTDDDVRSAAVAASIDAEVLSWNDGYETVVGHRSNAVSGGQRQRIAIARALAGRPDLLVLDEPTSALDAASEAAVHRAIDAVRGSATVVTVSHRLSFVRGCDRLLVLRDGQIAALGPTQDVVRDDPELRGALVGSADDVDR